PWTEGSITTRPARRTASARTAPRLLIAGLAELPVPVAVAAVAASRPVVDRDTPLRDVSLSVERNERERVPAVGDVLGALPVKESRESGWVARAVVVADQPPVHLDRDPEYPYRASSENVERQRACVGLAVGRGKDSDPRTREHAARSAQPI